MGRSGRLPRGSPPTVGHVQGGWAGKWEARYCAGGGGRPGRGGCAPHGHLRLPPGMIHRRAAPRAPLSSVAPRAATPPRSTCRHVGGAPGPTIARGTDGQGRVVSDRRSPRAAATFSWLAGNYLLASWGVPPTRLHGASGCSRPAAPRLDGRVGVTRNRRRGQRICNRWRPSAGRHGAGARRSRLRLPGGGWTPPRADLPGRREGGGCAAYCTEHKHTGRRSCGAAPPVGRARARMQAGRGWQARTLRRSREYTRPAEAPDPFPALHPATLCFCLSIKSPPLMTAVPGSNNRRALLASCCSPSSQGKQRALPPCGWRSPQKAWRLTLQRVRRRIARGIVRTAPLFPKPPRALWAPRPWRPPRALPPPPQSARSSAAMRPLAAASAETAPAGDCHMCGSPVSTSADPSPAHLCWARC